MSYAVAYIVFSGDYKMYGRGEINRLPKYDELSEIENEIKQQISLIENKPYNKAIITNIFRVAE